MKTSLILTSVLIWTIYIILIIVKLGVQPSVSQSYYKLKRKWIFSMVMAWTGLPIFTLAFLNDSFWFQEISLMLAGISLMFVGVAPAFRYNKIEEILHQVFAFGAVAFGYSALMFYDINYIALTIFSSIPCYYMMKRKTQNYVWYSELIAFYIVCLGLLFVK